MKHSKLILAISSLFVLGGVTASLTSNSIIRGNTSSSETWVHYNKKEATATEDGIREYWVKCGGGYQFTAPTQGNIQEATAYDISEFAYNDPRYIKWVDDAINIYYSLDDSSFDFCEMNVTSYTATKSVSKTPGDIARYEFYKDDNSIMFCAPCRTVSDVIYSNADIAKMQTYILDGTCNGYYVLGGNITSPTACITQGHTKTSFFTGTFDGRNHIISNPSFWGSRLFGTLQNATVKNIKFTNVAIFSVLAVEVYDSTIENLTFECADKVNKYANIGLIADIVHGSTLFKNVVVDFKDNYLANGFPLFGWNYLTDNSASFVNVTVKCLSSINAIRQDGYGRSLRPAEINFVSTQYFMENGNFKYDIRYISNNSYALEAANFIKQELFRFTGKTISMSTISNSDVIDTNTTSVVIGSDASLTSVGSSLPDAEGEYSLKAIGKAIYINSFTNGGYQVAARKLLEKIINFDYYGDGVYSYNADKTNIDLVTMDILKSSGFEYRKTDWSEVYFADCYALGYNGGYSDKQIFITVPAVGTFGNQQFHTALMIMYPGTYETAHPGWYAINSTGNKFGAGQTNPYAHYQLCYTARGNDSEYQAMVQTAANNVISIFAKNTNLQYNTLFFGSGDSYNRCHCTECENKIKQYGSIAGTEIKFLNDVMAKIEPRMSETKRDSINLVMFAYTSYKDAPMVNGSPTIKTADHIYTMVAPIEADYTVSITDSKNASSKKIIDDWSQVSTLYTWLYETNFRNYLYPYNSFKATTESIKYLASKGVGLCYNQGQHNLSSQPRTGFTALKKYLNGQFLMDQDSDYDSLVNKFFNNYYGTGGTSMRTFFNEMVTRLEYIEGNEAFQSELYNWSLANIYESINNANFWDYSQMKKWVDLCSNAYKAETNATYKKHILTESIFPRFAICTIFASKMNTNDLKSFRQSFKDDATSLGITYTNENTGTNPLSSYYSDWGI